MVQLRTTYAHAQLRVLDKRPYVVDLSLIHITVPGRLPVPKLGIFGRL